MKNFLTSLYIQELIKKENHMDMGNINGITVKSTKVNGLTDKKTVLGCGEVPKATPT